MNWEGIKKASQLAHELLVPQTHKKATQIVEGKTEDKIESPSGKIGKSSIRGKEKFDNHKEKNNKDFVFSCV